MADRSLWSTDLIDRFPHAHLLVMAALIVALSVAAPCQTSLFKPQFPSSEKFVIGDGTTNFSVAPFRADHFEEDGDAPDIVAESDHQPGLVHRSVKRVLEDQKEMYLAPFKPSNFKWD